MTAPEKIILDCKRWVDSNTGKFVNYSFEGEFRDADIYTTQDNVSYTRSDLYEAAQARIKELEVELQAIRDAWALVELERDKGVENLDFTDAFISFVNIIN